MNKSAMLVAVWLLVGLGCSSHKSGGDTKANAGKPKGMTTPGAMNSSGPMGGMRAVPTPAPGTAELKKMLEVNSKLVRLLASIQTLDDLKKQRPAYVALAVSKTKLKILSLRKALKLSPDQFGAYVQRTGLQNKANGDIGKKMRQQHTRIMKLKGAARIFAAIMEDLRIQLKPHSKEVGKLMKAFIARTGVYAKGSGMQR